MIAIDLAEVGRLTSGRLTARADPTALVSGPVVIDSRRAVAGSLFVCLPGERVDGHDYADEAVRAGAVAALAAHDVPAPAVLVQDPQLALGQLATGVLRRASQCTVVGVTGSTGKTSTKDLLAQVLAIAGPTVAPESSFNNELGLPLTVLSIAEETRTLVCEYSARGAGHIAYLCRIAPPEIGVVLNVGAAHLGEFGSRAAIAEAKGELVEAVPADGTAVLNADDALVRAMADRTEARVVLFGASERADVRIADLVVDEVARPSFLLVTPAGEARVRLGLAGAHHASNAAAAVAVALALGLDLDAVADALSRATSRSPHRMDVRRREDGLLVVDDAYNANPESMYAALEAFARLASGRRRWAVLGEMRELGEETAALHEALGRQVATAGIDELLAVGAAATVAEAAAAEAAAGRWSGRARVVADATAAIDVLTGELAADDAVLVKASNSLRLWQVADALLRGLPAGAAT